MQDIYERMWMIELKDLAQYLLYVALIIIPAWRILKRAGLNPAWAYLVFLPGLGPLAVIIILVYSDWPSYRKEF
jgi:hypothetical protein